MADTRATTIRFSVPIYERLEDAAEQTGLTINAIVVVACLEWLDEHPVESVCAEGTWGQLSAMPRHMPFWRGGLRGRSPGSRRAFDRFSARAKRAMAIAQDEAMAADHDLSPEYLLLGLAVEGRGVAAQTLEATGHTVDELRAAAATTTSSGGAWATTREIKRAIERAFDEAARRGHRFVGTEHLLLGLLDDARFAAIASQLREEVDRRLVSGASSPDPNA
jgi:hypothetical protein